MQSILCSKHLNSSNIHFGWFLPIEVSLTVWCFHVSSSPSLFLSTQALHDFQTAGVLWPHHPKPWTCIQARGLHGQGKLDLSYENYGDFVHSSFNEALSEQAGLCPGCRTSTAQFLSLSYRIVYLKEEITSNGQGKDDIPHMGMVVVLTWLIGDPRGSATSIMVRLLQMCYAGGLVIKTLQWSSYKNLGPEWGGPRDFHPLWLSWLEIIMKMIPGHVFYCPNLCIYLPILSHMTKDLSVIVLRPLTPHVEEIVVALPTYQETWGESPIAMLTNYCTS